MTTEERLKAMLGENQFAIAVLASQLEEAQKKIAKLEAKSVDEHDLPKKPALVKKA